MTAAGARGAGFVVAAVVGLALTLAVAPSAAGDPALSSTPMRGVTTKGTIGAGRVDAIASTGDVTYIGGEFSRVGRRTGPGVGVDAASGLDTGLPEVTGGGATVLAAASDEAGGFYVGGDFTHVGGVARDDIAHVLPDGSVDPGFDPQSVNGPVYALAVSEDGSTVYAGGKFSEIGGQSRDNLAALDAETGDADPSWAETGSGTVERVKAIAVAGSRVYVGGTFYQMAGQPKHNLAAVDAASGELIPWGPVVVNEEEHNPCTNCRVSEVKALAVSADRSVVYMGGDFRYGLTDSYGYKDNNGIAAISASSGDVLPWVPWLAGTNVYASSLALSGSDVYVGGSFDGITGLSEESLVTRMRDNIAAIPQYEAGGSYRPMATDWDPDASTSVNALAVSGSTLYAGGTFFEAGGAKRSGVAALNMATGDATPWDPCPYGWVNALAVSGPTVYVGGEFAGIGGVERENIAAIDNTSGAVTPWNPGADAVVNDLAVSEDGSTVYAGGNFSQIGGASRSRIAALDAAGGDASSWDPSAQGSGLKFVSALAVSGSTVYVGGDFSEIGGASRNSIAAIDAATGDATPWNPNAQGGTGRVGALAVSGSTVYVGGDFSEIGGASRDSIAAIDAATGNATSWDPDAIEEYGANVRALAVSGSTVYAGGMFSEIGGETRHNVAALDAASGNATSWDPGANGSSVADLQLSGSTVYVGGFFTAIGGEARNNVAALDSSSANAASWNPNVDTYGVSALAVAGSTVFVGGNFRQIGATRAGGIAAFGPPDSTPPETTIDSGPSGTTDDPTPTFAFHSSEVGSSFQCRIDNANFQPCSSPRTVASLADRSHTFEVKATDPTGNIDSTPASRGFAIDTTPPPGPTPPGPTPPGPTPPVPTPVAPSTPGSAPSQASQPSSSQSSNAFGFGKAKANKRKGTALLIVKVGGPGMVVLAKTRDVAGGRVRARSAGRVKLRVVARGKAKKTLNRKGRIRVKVRVTFKPNGGSPRTKTTKVVLIKRRRSRH